MRKDPGTSSRFDPALDDHVRAEVEEIAFIYRTLHPDSPLGLFLYETESCVWGDPRTQTGPATTPPSDMAGKFLGEVPVHSGEGSLPRVNVSVAIPRRPSPDEIERHEVPVNFRDWKPRFLFSISPMTFEYLKFLHERRVERRSFLVHKWEKLPITHDRPVETTGKPRTGKKKPAILVGFHWLEAGGAEDLAFSSVQYALDVGLRVFVICQRQCHHRRAQELLGLPDVHFVRTDRYLRPEALSQFVNNLIAQENVKLVHIHHHASLYETLPTLRMAHPDVKVIDSTHIIEYADGRFPRISGVWSNFIDHHHVISRQLVDMFKSRFFVQDKVHLGRLIERKRVTGAIEPFSMQAGQHEYTLAFVGRMNYQKRPTVAALILRALKSWADRNAIRLNFNVVGEGDYLPIFKRLLSRYDLESMTNLFPATGDVPTILKNSDVLLVPSANEGLALVCYEAIENGAIPVSSNVGAQDEIMPPELLVDPDPRKTLSQTVAIFRRLTRDEEFLELAKSRLVEKFRAISADQTAQELFLSIYEDAAGNRP